MRRTLAILSLLASAWLGEGAGNPAHAEGNWTDFSLAGQTPFCGGGGCPTLAASCQSASYS
jgi:hypothetical protein